MATIIGGIGTSHVPAIGAAIAKGQQQSGQWKPFFDAYKPAQAWLEAAKPDVAVVFYNDHGLNFFLDALPTFAVGAAAEYQNADEGWGLSVTQPYLGDPDLSWRLIEDLVEEEFDITSCQRMLVDHAFTIPMKLLWPNGAPVRVVPIAINTVQHPLPSAARCFKLGQAVGRAIRRHAGESQRVVFIGTGGLSHQLDGSRAGFINKPFDRMCLEQIVEEPACLTHYSIRELIALAGAQGVELLMWLAMRGAVGDCVARVHSHYQVPISNTAAGLLVIEPERPGEWPSFELAQGAVAHADRL
ncbi:MAG: class III extradiol dioxygenase family protein [Caulobacteraceae bacterium]